MRVDAAPFKHGREEAWTEAETLLLLEALEMYDDGDWDKVADHVGTRSREQCVAHFLQLPIEDPFLEQSQSDLGPLRYGATMPFNQSDNPILSVVAFLASVVDPKVAAAAAHSAVDELKSGLGGRKAAAVEADVKPDTGMQVDGEETPAKSDIGRTASVAIGAAAAKAAALAASEDRDLRRLVRETVQAQVKKLDLKLKQFDELEAALELERRGVESLRQQLTDERLSFAESHAGLAEIQTRFANAPQSVTAQDIANVAASGATSGYPPRATPVNPAPPASFNGVYASI